MAQHRSVIRKHLRALLAAHQRQSSSKENEMQGGGQDRTEGDAGNVHPAMSSEEPITWPITCSSTVLRAQAGEETHTVSRAESIKAGACTAGTAAYISVNVAQRSGNSSLPSAVNSALCHGTVTPDTVASSAPTSFAEGAHAPSSLPGMQQGAVEQADISSPNEASATALHETMRILADSLLLLSSVDATIVRTMMTAMGKAFLAVGTQAEDVPTAPGADDVSARGSESVLILTTAQECNDAVDQLGTSSLSVSPQLSSPTGDEATLSSSTQPSLLTPLPTITTVPEDGTPPGDDHSSLTASPSSGRPDSIATAQDLTPSENDQSCHSSSPSGQPTQITTTGQQNEVVLGNEQSNQSYIADPSRGDDQSAPASGHSPASALGQSPSTVPADEQDSASSGSQSTASSPMPQLLAIGPPNALHSDAQSTVSPDVEFDPYRGYIP